MTGQRGQLDRRYDRASLTAAGPGWLAPSCHHGIRRLGGILPGSSLNRHIDPTIQATAPTPVRRPFPRGLLATAILGVVRR
jgi:hypothetical protein